MTIRLLYFAWVREKLGRSEEAVTLPDHVTTIAGLMAWLAARGEGYQEVFSRVGVIRAAIDQTHAQPGQTIAGAREIAFFPPVTGG
jgi:sulfur-carrier protein